jgi:ribonuclease HI
MPGTQKELCIFVDGSSRGNPGPAGIGIAVFEPNKTDATAEISKYIGRTTNNVAEYEAVIHALRWMIHTEAQRAVLKLDSELVYKQIKGTYRVKSPHIAFLMKRIETLRAQIDDVSFVLVPRDENKLANRLAQRASKKVKVKHKTFKQLAL